MSTWFRFESTTPDHPKVAKLARKLGVTRVQALGHLTCLWARVCAASPDGDLTSYDADDLAVFASWEGDEAALTEALVAARLIDEVRQGDELLGYELHDWMERAEGHKRAKAARDRREAERAAQREARQVREPDAAPARDARITDASPTRSARDPATGPRGQTGQTDTPPKPPAGGLPLPAPPAPKAPKDPPQRKEPRARWFLHAAERAKRLDAVARVVEAYQRHHPRARPGPLERGVIAERLLADGFSVEDLTEAIDGAHVPGCWHAEQGGSALALEVLLRDSAKVEKHRRTLEEHRAGRGRKAGAEAAEAAWVEVQEALPRWRRHEDVELSAGARAGLRAIGGSSRILGADPRAMGALKADFLAGARGVRA